MKKKTIYKYELRTRTTHHEIAVLRINTVFKSIADYFILYGKVTLTYLKIFIHNIKKSIQ